VGYIIAAIIVIWLLVWLLKKLFVLVGKLFAFLWTLFLFVMPLAAAFSLAAMCVSFLARDNALTTASFTRGWTFRWACIGTLPAAVTGALIVYRGQGEFMTGLAYFAAGAALPWIMLGLFVLIDTALSRTAARKPE